MQDLENPEVQSQNDGSPDSVSPSEKLEEFRDDASKEGR
tara:strand:- start:3 stop:119 length:117 start_codon:yes stop_codon:yes gene_type:complete